MLTLLEAYEEGVKAVINSVRQGIAQGLSVEATLSLAEDILLKKEN